MWGAIALGKDDVASLRAEGYLDSVGECIYATLEAFASLYIELDFFCHDTYYTLYVVLLLTWG